MTDRRYTGTTGIGGVKIGTELNQTYMIDSLIGVGGMGEVFRGHNIQTADPVAIKIVLPEFARDEMILELFRKEARILNHLAHDAIVRYYVFSIDKALGRPYLAMEYVDGPSLAEKLKSGPLSEDDVAVLQNRLADGLQRAHEAGVIHRDMSPDNVILPDGNVKSAKIIDFGIARSANVGGATLLGGSFAGKYNYVSPEQLGLYGGDVTPKSDIYSLALVLAAALRGEPLDMSGTQLEVIEKRRIVPDLSDISPRFRDLLDSMLQPEPGARPATMAEVRDWTPPAQPRPVQADDATIIRRPTTAGDRKPSKAEEKARKQEQPQKAAAAPPEPVDVEPRMALGTAQYVLIALALIAMIAGGAFAGWYYVRQNQIVAAVETPVSARGQKPESSEETVKTAQPEETPPPEPQEQAAPPPEPAPVVPEPEKAPEPQAQPEPLPAPVSEALQRPAAADTGALESFVNGYRGGCLHLTAESIGAQTADISAFARNESAVSSFRTEFATKAGFAPNVKSNVVAEPQCPAIDGMSSLASSGASRIDIVMGQQASPAASGKIVVEATVRKAGNRSINVLLVTDDGGVQNINRLCAKCLSFAGDELKIRLPLERPPGSGDTAEAASTRPLLLIAVASPRNVFSISAQNIYNAADVFPALVEEIRQSSEVSAGIGYFRF